MLKEMRELAKPRIGLGVLIFNIHNQILLGKRKNSHGSSTWGPSGGHLEFGETFEECAKREVLEETGLVINDIIYLNTTNDYFEAENKHYVSIFMKAKLVNNQTVRNLEPDKIDEWQWCSLDALPENLFLPLKNFLTVSAYNNLYEIPKMQILDELVLHEHIFINSEKFGKTRYKIEDQMCDEFFEVGASGNIYTKEDVIGNILARYDDANYQNMCETSNFKLTPIARDNYLLTYDLTQNKVRNSRRSTIWRKVEGKWKILYHQGTIIE